MAVTGRIRVLIHAHTPPDDDQAVTAAYHDISRQLQGTPGLIGNELLRSLSDPASFVVLSEWESLEAFRTWEESAGHRSTTSPLRPYAKGAGVYEVTASY